VKILLDESAPRLLKLRLSQLEISTVQEMGWAGIRNGELLRRTEAGFDVFITADQNLRYQQNLSGRTLAVTVLPSNQVPVVDQLLPQIETTLATIRPGTVVEIPDPGS
jgi:hypothetical protein